MKQGLLNCRVRDIGILRWRKSKYESNIEILLKGYFQELIWPWKGIKDCSVPLHSYRNHHENWTCEEHRLDKNWLDTICHYYGFNSRFLPFLGKWNKELEFCTSLALKVCNTVEILGLENKICFSNLLFRAIIAYLENQEKPKQDRVCQTLLVRLKAES